jgi:hypothetical protein
VIGKMAVFEIETYVVYPEKVEEHELVLKEIFNYGKMHPDVSRHVKSLRVFKQGIGGDPVGSFVLVTEFESLSEIETFYAKLKKDKEWQEIAKKWAKVIDLKSMHISIWNDMCRELWIEK